MKIHTAEDLVDYLEFETSWRKRELSIINSEINKNIQSTFKINTLLRGAVTLLYAHWEGYVKNSSIAYLSHISNQKLEYKKLNSNIRAVGIKKDLFEMFYKNSDKMEKLQVIIDLLVNKQDQKCTFNPEKVINTKSNLNSKLFKEIVITLDLDYKNYETKENIIDQKLLYYRNNIGHGKELFINQSDYQDLSSEIITLIDFFKTDLENSAIQKGYLVANKTI